MFVTVYTHRGIKICTLSPAKPGYFGYIIDDVRFMGREFDFVQQAIDAIDDWNRE